MTSLLLFLPCNSPMQCSHPLPVNASHCSLNVVSTPPGVSAFQNSLYDETLCVKEPAERCPEAAGRQPGA